MLTLFLAFAVTTTDVDMVQLPLGKQVRVALAPAGQVDIKQDGTVTRIKLEIDRLQAPTNFGPALNAYVVWTVSPEGTVENIGELELNGSKGKLEATSRLTTLGILVTAEPHYMVDRPNSTVVGRNQPVRDEVRRTPVSIEVGDYDYSSLKPSLSAPHPSVAEARAAVQIAENAGAARLAEREFRNARVALGSMEELLMRGAPLDIFWPAANEAIRWSQRAVTVSREKEALNTLQTVKNELEAERTARQELDSRVAELAAQQSAVEEQVRRLQSELESANRTKAELTVQRDQARARAQRVEAEVAQLRQKQDDLQSHLNVRWRDDFFDDSGLTDAGREALLRVRSIAEVVEGPIVLEGEAPEDVIKAAIEFLVLAGIPQERIITRR